MVFSHYISLQTFKYFCKIKPAVETLLFLKCFAQDRVHYEEMNVFFSFWKHIYKLLVKRTFLLNETFFLHVNELMISRKEPFSGGRELRS